MMFLSSTALLLVSALLVTAQPTETQPTYDIASALAFAEEMGWDLGDVTSEDLSEETVPYTLPDGSSANGILVTPINGATTGNLVVILADWDGVGSFEVANAVRLAALGNAAFVADTYGSEQAQGEDAELSNEIKGSLAGSLKSNAENYREIISSAIATAQSTEGTPYEDVAIFGYCLGGGGVMEYARNDPAKIEAEGVTLMVAFHPGATTSTDDSSITTSSENGFMATLLLNQGTADAGAVSADQVESVKGELDGAESWLLSAATYYTGALHGFTQPGASYNEFAAEMSWANAIYALGSGVEEDTEMVASETESVPTDAVVTPSADDETGASDAVVSDVSM
ncbi:hypothetical protein SARC_01196 [Sphaeroforma arctica JP610]|uniref:Dienelactone hydrolase domain-containing protein n=1 Tax=Sphaeroforma arctica JP610 TaxID=667725 RepID=A0A0L0GCM7_9EUKA|nr:hypothetical protein SARC_01196 [Sphaeroforma arctica JP610]KNC86659.1 hypothetical protein SARC_01196 [Sphaeroforma arctica JP610]|eukprot:XP_014160561.1 hypothetical protein SARC_01196 [Sphaeroforma arctica JP610]